MHLTRAGRAETTSHHPVWVRPRLAPRAWQLPLTHPSPKPAPEVEQEASGRRLHNRYLSCSPAVVRAAYILFLLLINSSEACNDSPDRRQVVSEF